MTLGISQDGLASAVVIRDPQISVVSSKKEFMSINAAFPSLSQQRFLYLIFTRGPRLHLSMFL